MFAYRLTGTLGALDGAPSLPPGESATVCFAAPGVHRIRTTDTPYSGGFVIVDPERAR